MGTLTKTLVILNLVLTIAFVMISATVLSQRTHWREKYRIADGEVRGLRDDLARQKDDYDRKLREQRNKADKATTDLEEANRTLKEREDAIKAKDATISEQKTALNDAKTLTDSLTKTVDRVTNDFKTIQETLAARNKELEDARATIAQRDRRVAELDDQVAKLDSKQKDQELRLESAKKDLEQLKNYRQGVQALAPAIHQQVTELTGGGAVPPRRITTAVRAVDMKAGVVVLNVGSNAETPVQEGYMFLIRRGGNFVAAVRVKRVDKEMCLAEIVPPAPTSDVQVGDSAFTQF